MYVTVTFMSMLPFYAEMKIFCSSGKRQHQKGRISNCLPNHHSLCGSL